MHQPPTKPVPPVTSTVCVISGPFEFVSRSANELAIALDVADPRGAGLQRPAAPFSRPPAGSSTSTATTPPRCSRSPTRWASRRPTSTTTSAPRRRSSRPSWSRWPALSRRCSTPPRRSTTTPRVLEFARRRASSPRWSPPTAPSARSTSATRRCAASSRSPDARRPRATRPAPAVRRVTRAPDQVAAYWIVKDLAPVLRRLVAPARRRAAGDAHASVSARPALRPRARAATTGRSSAGSRPSSSWRW